MTAWASRQARRIKKARQLIQPGLPDTPGVWADFGCGEGIFTAALYSLLPKGSVIIAIDQRRAALQQLERNFAGSYPAANLQIIHQDFHNPLELPPLDGFMMANALHFTKNKKPLLRNLTAYLRPGGRLIVVEYNTRRGNFAVPYPLDEAQFLALAGSLGLVRPAVLAKIPSTFLGEMFSGIAFRPATPE